MRRLGVSFSFVLMLGVPYLGLNACGGSSKITYVEAGGGEMNGSGGTLGGTGAVAGSNAVGGSASGKGGRAGTGGSGAKGGADSGGQATSGGAAGEAPSGGGEAGMMVDPGCLSTGCPAGKFCDEDSRKCLALKDPGDDCSLSQQCKDLLYCLDGVCCEDRECPACTNCGSDGQCSVTVTSKNDTTGVKCQGKNSCDGSGECRQILGEACNDDQECVSGHCVDNVCCGEAACEECTNCGADGACSVAVKNKDDDSSDCNGNNTCGADSMCVQRWSLVGATTVTGAFHQEFTAVINDTLFFANASNESATQYHKGYSVTTGLFYDIALTNNEYCYCGYGGVAVADGSKIYYFANGGVSLVPSASAWVDVPNYTSSGFYDGESATALVNGRIYRVSGRDNPDRTAYFDITAGTFVTTGLAAHPIPDATYQRCAGSANNRLYVFGWDTVMSEYNPSTNTWSTTAQDPNAPESCAETNVPLWGNHFVYAYSGVVKQFNVSTLKWEAGGIPLPDPAGLQGYKALVVGSDLYVLGYRRTGKQVEIYKYVLP